MNLFKDSEITTSESSDDEDVHATAMAALHPEITKKLKTGLWSDSESDSGGEIGDYRAELGIDSDKSYEDVNAQLFNPTGTRTRPWPGSSSEPVAGTSGIVAGSSKQVEEKWSTKPSSSSYVLDTDSFKTVESGEDMFADCEEPSGVDAIDEDPSSVDATDPIDCELKGM